MPDVPSLGLAHQRSRAALEIREIRARSWRQGVSYFFAKATHFADRFFPEYRRRKNAKALRFR